MPEQNLNEQYLSTKEQEAKAMREGMNVNKDGDSAAKIDAADLKTTTEGLLAEIEGEVTVETKMENAEAVIETALEATTALGVVEKELKAFTTIPKELKVQHERVLQNISGLMSEITAAVQAFRAALEAEKAPAATQIEAPKTVATTFNRGAEVKKKQGTRLSAGVTKTTTTARGTDVLSTTVSVGGIGGKDTGPTTPGTTDGGGNGVEGILNTPPATAGDTEPSVKIEGSFTRTRGATTGSKKKQK